MSLKSACNPVSSPTKVFLQVSQFDFIVIGVIVLISLSVLWVMNVQPVLAESVIIYKDNVKIKELKLNQAALIEFQSMKIEIKDSAVRIVKSDCPRGICQHSGGINRPGSTIACVPKRVLVEIAGRNKERTYDAITY